MADKGEYKSPDKFDKMHGSLTGRSDVTRVKASSVTVHTPLIGATQAFIIETMRVAGEGDTVFLQYVDDAGSVRIYLPPQVVEAIARQREAITLKTRKRIGREAAQARKARGELPGFMKGKKK